MTDTLDDFVTHDIPHHRPYSDVAPYSVSSLLLHFESNFPFATFRTANKEIEVSHWGNVAVEELYSLEHTGATLKGGFSRAQYARSTVLAVDIIAIIGPIFMTTTD